MELASDIYTGIAQFSLVYPIIMAVIWIAGGTYHYCVHEIAKRKAITGPPDLKQYPKITLLVPCYNEQKNARETVDWLNRQNYPDFEILAINDGSSDATGDILDELTGEYDRLKVIHLATNQGKGMALRMGALAANSEYLICIDGDALLDPNAGQWMLKHFLDDPSIGGVTGNPRIRNRSTVLGKLQVGEFSAVIGLIKRTQQLYGRIFSMSGVISGFRKSALHSIDYWRLDQITEDIDVTWRLQLKGWKIVYEPNALCWTLMPETLQGLWQQRLRWARGGVEVLLAYGRNLPRLLTSGMWLIAAEFVTSILWVGSILIFSLTAIANALYPLPIEVNMAVLIPFIEYDGALLVVITLVQFGVSLIIDSRYEPGTGKHYYWMIWYPLAYWMITMSTIIVAVPKVLIQNKSRATWVSPDRGINL